MAWHDDSERFAAVKAAELALLSSPVRRDADAVRALLAPDFVEIGGSGRRWTLDDIVSSLAAEAPRSKLATSEWKFNELTPGFVLVNYRIDGAKGASRRSSIWELTAQGPVLRFHQGTLTSG